jgi:hypothetical protein
LGLVQTLVFLVLQLLTLFVSAGRGDIVEFWLYIVMIAAVSGLSLAILDPDLVANACVREANAWA